MKDLIPYAAGLFDGEGYVGILRTSPQTKTTASPLPRYRLAVGMHMVPRVALDALRDQWGGSIYFRANKSPNQDTHRWDIQALKAQRFLEDISPYLLIKREQVSTGLELQRHLTENGGNRYKGQGFQRLPLDETVAYREGLYQRLRFLNLRGEAKRNLGKD